MRTAHIPRACWLLAGLVLIGVASYRRHVDLPFIELFTGDASAQSVFGDQPYPFQVLAHNLARLALVTGRAYVFPTWVLFVPGVLMVVRALRARMPDACHQQWIPTTSHAPDQRHPRRTVWALLAAALVVCLLAVHVLVLQSSAFSTDEFDYLFQARILLQGRLYLDSPPMPDFFSSVGVINDGRTYSGYQIGWPLLLAVGLLAHIPALVNPLLGALGLGLLYQLGRMLFDETVGVLGALLFMCSPFFVLNAASYSIHPAVLCCTLAAPVCYLWGLRQQSPGWLGGCAVSLVLLTLTRIVDLVAAVPLLVVATMHHYGASLRAFTRPRSLVPGLCVALGVGLQGAINWAQTGHPLLFAFNVYDPTDRWGFGAHGHTAARALSNVTYYLARLTMWLPALCVESSVLGVAPFNRWSLALAGGALLPIAFYAGHFSLGVVEYGPRYWFVPAAFLSLLAARGMVRVARALAARWGSSPRAVVGVWAGAVLLTTAGQQVAIARSVHATVASMVDPLREVDRRLAERTRQALVFIRSAHIGRGIAANGTPADFIRNDPQLSDPILHVFYLAPEDNRRLIASMPSRAPFELSYDQRRGSYAVRPYRDPTVGSDRVDAWRDAGLNYLIGLKQPDRAADMMRRILAVDGREVRALGYLGRISRDQGQLSAAVAFWREALALRPDMTQIRYSLGAALLKLGEVAEAEREWQRVVEESPQSSEGRRAAAWLQKIKAPQ